MYDFFCQLGYQSLMSLSHETCAICAQPKATLQCGVCSEVICKKCVQRLPENAFAFLKNKPLDLSHQTYCSACFSEKVESALESYNEVLERAKTVYIFYKSQRKDIPLLRRSKVLVSVAENYDRDETILRLAFFAAQQSFNALTEVEVVAEKIRNGSYQTSKWKGSGFPTLIDTVKADRQAGIDEMYI